MVQWGIMICSQGEVGSGIALAQGSSAPLIAAVPVFLLTMISTKKVRVISAGVPFLITFSIVAVFTWLFVWSSQGSPPPTCASSADGSILLRHLIPPGSLAALLLVSSIFLPVACVVRELVYGSLVLTITMIALHAYTWGPRIFGGWTVSVSINPLLYGVPLFGTIAALIGAVLGYLSFQYFHSTSRDLSPGEPG